MDAFVELAAWLRVVAPPLLAAAALGGAIGWEREWRSKPAGLRTHILVSLGAAAFTVVTLDLYASLGPLGAAASSDPLRIVEGVIGGIGFLGAGSIIRQGGSVEGLTTAGTVWLAGAVGLACGTGRYGVATLVVVLALFVLLGIGALEDRLFDGRDGARRRNRKATA